MNYLKRLLKNKKSLNNAIIILLVGVFLIALSNSFLKGSGKNTDSSADKAKLSFSNKEADNKDLQKSDQTDSSSLSYESELEQRLEKTLAMVQGVGRIKVMINTEEGYENIIKNDYKSEKYTENGSSKDINEEVTVFDENGEPVILKEVKPKINGVVIVAEGGDNVLVKNSLINAVKALLGIEAHKIEILKMK